MRRQRNRKKKKRTTWSCIRESELLAKSNPQEANERI